MYDGRSHERQFLTAWLSRARSPPLLSYPVARLFIGSRASCSPRALPGYAEKLRRRNRPFAPAGAPPAEACPFFSQPSNDIRKKRAVRVPLLDGTLRRNAPPIYSIICSPQRRGASSIETYSSFFRIISRTLSVLPLISLCLVWKL